VIKEADKQTERQLEMMSFNSIPDNIFFQDASFGDFDFTLNFDIDKAFEFVNKYNVTKKEIMINWFGMDIMWNEENGQTRHDINESIIITDLPLGRFKQVVIDGNHRLTKLKKDNVATVNVREILPLHILQHGILPYVVDQVLYTFILETTSFNYLLNNLLEEGYKSHEDLYKISNIHNTFKTLNKS